MFGLLFITLLLSGCEDENRVGLHGNDDDFIGTWKTEAGSFTMGDSIRFNENYGCDFFWSGGTTIFSGTWNRTYRSQLGYCIVINMSNQEWTYKYDFFDNYRKLRFKLEDSSEYIYYIKQ